MTPTAIARKFVGAALHVEGVMRETLDYTNVRRDSKKIEFVINSLADRQSFDFRFNFDFQYNFDIDFRFDFDFRYDFHIDFRFDFDFRYDFHIDFRFDFDFDFDFRFNFDLTLPESTPFWMTAFNSFIVLKHLFRHFLTR